MSTSVLGEDRSVMEDRTVMEDKTVVEDRTAVRAEPDIKEEEESDGTLMPVEEQKEGDSLVEDLLSDEEA